MSSIKNCDFNLVCVSLVMTLIATFITIIMILRTTFITIIMYNIYVNIMMHVSRVNSRCLSFMMMKFVQH